MLYIRKLFDVAFLRKTLFLDFEKASAGSIAKGEVSRFFKKKYIFYLCLHK